MKKIIVLTAIVSLLSFGLVLPVLADEATSTPPAGEQPSVASPTLTPFKIRQVVVYGGLTAISSPTVPSDLTVKLTRVIPSKVRRATGDYLQKGGTVVVKVDEKSNIVRKYMGKAALSELAVNDKLMVTGKLQEDGSIIAQLVKDNSIHITFQARVGEVISIDTTVSSFIFMTNKKEFKIFVTPNTKFSKWGVEKPTFADLKVGDKAKVRGVIRQTANEITADSVVIQVSKEEMRAKQLEIKKANLAKQLEKKKANLIKQLEKKKAQLEKKIEKIKGRALEKARKELDEVNKQLQEKAETSAGATATPPATDQNTGATTTVTQ